MLEEDEAHLHVDARTPRYTYQDDSQDKNDAMENYQSSGYVLVNEHLRSSTDNPSDRTLHTIHHLRGWFRDASPTDQDILVHRGVYSPQDMFGKVGSKVGQVFHDKGFTSTSTRQRVSKRFVDPDNPSYLHITIPKGSTVVAPEDHSKGESEVLLNSNSRFRVDQDYEREGHHPSRSDWPRTERHTHLTYLGSDND